MSLQKLTAELYQSFESKNYEQCQKLLPPIKIELIKHNLLVPTTLNTSTTDQLNDLKIAQKILEIGALSSLLSNSYQSFENYFAQLKPFYENIKLTTSSSSTTKKSLLNSETTKIVSLYLLYLLSQGSISKFHIELETIYNSSQFDAEKDKYLQFPINLERNLMEGNYIKIWKLLNESDSKLPCQEYTHFTSTLITALRFEISKSLERTYDSLPINNCKSLLYFPQEQSDQVFEKILKEELEVENWEFFNGKIYFNVKDAESLEGEKNSTTIINNVLSYAGEIESIV